MPDGSENQRYKASSVRVDFCEDGKTAVKLEASLPARQLVHLTTIKTSAITQNLVSRTDTGELDEQYKDFLGEDVYMVVSLYGPVADEGEGRDEDD